MAYEVSIQPTALAELESIAAHLSGFGPNTLRSFLDDWERMLEGLHDGTVEHRLSRFSVLAKLGYHSVLVRGYIVLYFREGERVIVAHIFHQSQDYARIVLEGK